MIRLFFGNIGSGKTASAVREIVLHRYKPFPVITNIQINEIKRVIPLKIEYIVETYEDEKGKKKFRLNEQYWKDMKEKHGQLDVVIDEAHLVLNARRSGSKVNVVMSDWLALLRRVVGSHGGTLTLITQLERRLDVISKEMATTIYHHRAHYKIYCSKGCFAMYVNSDLSEIPKFCPQCHKQLAQTDFVIEVNHFKSIHEYQDWLYGMQASPKTFLIHDIETFFPLYDTEQWDDLTSSLYT